MNATSVDSRFYILTFALHLLLQYLHHINILQRIEASMSVVRLKKPWLEVIYFCTSRQHKLIGLQTVRRTLQVQLP